MWGSLPERRALIYCCSVLAIIERVRIVEWDVLDKFCANKGSKSQLLCLTKCESICMLLMLCFKESTCTGILLFEG